MITYMFLNQMQPSNTRRPALLKTIAYSIGEKQHYIHNHLFTLFILYNYLYINFIKYIKGPTILKNLSELYTIFKSLQICRMYIEKQC